MIKILVTLAGAAALAAPAAAFAQASHVTIYGRANLGLDNYSATGATIGSAGDYRARNRIYDAGSRLGFSGTEDLGGGLKALFLIESGVNIDTGNGLGQAGSPNPFSGLLSSRIGYVGLQGNWGRLTFGKNNVWWANYPMEQTGATYVATGLSNFYGLLGRGMNLGVSRVSNLVQYAAQARGITAIVSYAANGEARPAGADSDGRLWGLTVQGQWGAVGAGYDWVKNWGNTGTGIGGAQPASSGHKLRAGWAYQPGAQIAVIWAKVEQDNGGFGAITAAGAGLPIALGLALMPDATATSLSQTSWGLSWEHTFGKMLALAQWGKVNNITGCKLAGACNNTSATTWMAGLRYNISKRTGLYFNYTAIHNDSNYNMDYIGGWMTSASYLGALPGLPPSSVGADPRMYGVGVMHNF